jgi:hypothetical protein
VVGDLDKLKRRIDELEKSNINVLFWFIILKVGIETQGKGFFG